MSFDIGELVGTIRMDDAQATQAVDKFSKKTKTAGQDVQKSLDSTSKSTDQIGKGFDKAGTSAATFGSSAKKAFGALAGLAAGGALVSFLSSSVTAASDLNETMSKTDQIFGKSADSVKEWGQTAATSVGLSTGAALEATSNFGNMFTQLGFTGDAAADLSKQVVQMSADLGSFNNLPTADVAERISAAFRGEYDSLQLLIPNINAARVEQEALAATGKTSADQLTAQEKATAVLAIVTKDGSKAMGDFARTSEGLANQQKIAAAELENTKAAIGERLMPVALELMNVFRDVGIPAIEAFGAAIGVLADVIGPLVRLIADIPAPILAMAAAFAVVQKYGGLGAMLSGLGRQVSNLKGAFERGADGSTRFAKSLGSIATTVAEGAAFAVVGTVIAAWAANAEHNAAAAEIWKQEVEELAAALVAANGEWDKTSRAVQDAQITGDATFRTLIARGLDYGTTLAAIKGDADAMAKTQQAMRDAGFQEKDIDFVIAMSQAFQMTAADAQKFADAQIEYNRQQEAAAKISAEVGGSVEDMGGSFLKASGDMGKFSGSIKPSLDDLKTLKTELAGADTPLRAMELALADVDAEAQAAATSIEYFGIKLNELNGIDITAEQATKLLNDQVRNIKGSFEEATEATGGHVESLIDVTGAIDTTSEAGSQLFDDVQAYRGAYDTATQSAYDQAIAQGDVEGALGKAQTAATGAREKFLLQAEALGINREEAVLLADRYGILDGTKISDKNFEVNADDEQARAAIGFAVGASIADKFFTIHATASTGAAQSAIDAFINRNAGRSVGLIGQFLGGGATGGPVRHIAGLAAGGPPSRRLPGIPPSDPGRDNLLGMVNGTPIALRSREWVIDEPTADYYGDAFFRAMQRRMVPRTARGLAEGGPVMVTAQQAAAAGILGIRVTFDGTDGLGQALAGSARVEIDRAEGDLFRAAMLERSRS